MRRKETETTSLPRRPQRPRPAGGPASGVVEGTPSGKRGWTGGALSKNDKDWGVQWGGRGLRRRRLGIVGCSGEMGREQWRGWGRLQKSGSQPGV